MFVALLIGPGLGVALTVCLLDSMAVALWLWTFGEGGSNNAFGRQQIC